MSDKTPEISVIVPVYNVEKYLPQCLDSILGSTFKDIEVILVDDCGPDNSRAICDEYAAKDKRVRVIANPRNMGVGASRNRGLEYAKGKYISFIDSDDYIDATMYEKLYAAMVRENVDMVGCNAWSVEGDDTREIIHYLGVKKDIKTSFEKLNNKIYSDAFHLWRMLFKSEMLRNIRFSETISLAEDAIFLLQVYPLLQDIYFLAEPLYFYRRSRNTLSTRCHKRNFETLKIKDAVIESFNKNPRADLIRDEFWNWYTNNLVGFYNLIPLEMQAKFVAEVQQMVPYRNYVYFISEIEDSYEKYYLFDFILLLTVRKRQGKKYVKLFGKIPLYKVKISVK